MSTAEQNSRLPLFAIDVGMLVATLLTLAGYLMPWFRPSSRAIWSFSGWAYASLSDGVAGPCSPSVGCCWPPWPRCGHGAAWWRR